MLPIAEYAHNSWRHDITRRSPHELLIGIKPQVHVKFLSEDVPASADCIKALEDTRKEVQTLLEHQQSLLITQLSLCEVEYNHAAKQALCITLM
jgi:hypothetical protein